MKIWHCSCNYFISIKNNQYQVKIDFLITLLVTLDLTALNDFHEKYFHNANYYDDCKYDITYHSTIVQILYQISNAQPHALLF